MEFTCVGLQVIRVPISHSLWQGGENIYATNNSQRDNN